MLLAKLVGQVCLFNFVDSRFRPFGAGIINEVLLARHPQALTIPII